MIKRIFKIFTVFIISLIILGNLGKTEAALKRNVYEESGGILYYYNYFGVKTKYSGTHNNTFYKNGKKYTGIYYGFYYKNGKPGTGVKNGTYYKKGLVGTGVYKNTYYKNGKKATGWYNNVYYIKGSIARGWHNGVKYSGGKMSLSAAQITLSKTRYTYDGNNKKPKVTVKLNGKKLKKSDSYTIKYSNNKNAGTAKVVIEGKKRYTGAESKLFTINRKVLNTNNTAITLNPTNFTYSFKGCKPSVKVIYNKKVFSKSNYIIKYINNKNAGTATVKITFKNNYTGTISKNYTIKKLPLSNKSFSISLSKTSYNYDGNAKKPSVTVKYNNQTVSNTNYTVTYSNNTYVGKATVVVKGKNNLSGSITKTFTINATKTKTDLPESVNSQQGGEIYNNKLFIFSAGGSCKVYDLNKNNKLIGTFKLPNAKDKFPHCNSVSFSKTFYTKNDTYPLLYINAYNDAGVQDGTCYVYRITVNKNGKFSCQLIQTIQMGITNSNKWKNPKETRLTSGNFVIDTDNNYLYVYNLRESENKTRFFKCKIPPTINNSSKTVTISNSDILETFDCRYFPFIQDSCYHKGYIYILSGITDYHLWKINLKNKKVSELTLPKKPKNVKNFEPESIAIHNNHAIVSFTDYGKSYTYKISL